MNMEIGDIMIHKNFGKVEIASRVVEDMVSVVTRNQRPSLQTVRVMNLTPIPAADTLAEVATKFINYFHGNNRPCPGYWGDLYDAVQNYKEEQRV